MSDIIEIGKKPEPITPPEEFSCGTCFHGTENPPGGVICKRNPPQVLLVPLPPRVAGGDTMLSFQSVRPTLPYNDTCGEWESREEIEDDGKTVQS